MTHVRVKLIGASAAIIIAVALLALAGVKEGWIYYLPVDDFVGKTDYHDQRVRLQGSVGEENPEVSSGLLMAKFDLLGDSEQLRIEYSGVIPDMFKAGTDVVVEGRMVEGESGVFKADTLITKCASKYESEDGDGRPAEHPATESPE